MSRVYELRKALCMSRADIGKWINRSASYIWSIENGRAPVPVDQICSALHVRREWLENGAGAMFEDECDPQSIAERVVQLRKAFFYTQDDFADLLGISHSHIHRIEKAKSEIPVDAICTVLGAEKDWLLTGQGEMLKAETPLPDYGSHIRELREYLGLSLNTMAAELGVNPTNLSRNECGQAPSKDTINKIRSVYGVTDSWMRYGTAPMFEPGKERKKKEPVDGSRLKKIREGAKLSQKEFAERIGKKHSSITYMEDGRMAITEGTIQAVLAAFPIREEWLRYGEGRMYQEGFSGKKGKQEIVGSRLREFRERYKLKQEDVAKRTGLGHTTISNIELGVQKTAQKTVDALCRELQINESWLRGRDVPMSSGIGARAAQIRKHLGMSVREMGKKLGTTGQGYHNMETGVYYFSTEQIRTICNECGISEEWLLYGLGSMFQPGREIPPKVNVVERKAKKQESDHVAKEEKEAENAKRREYIKTLREKMGLNQIDFGNLIGKPGPYISNLESGQRGVSDAVWDKVSKLDETAIHREKNQKKTKPKGCGLIKENITALRTFLGLSQEEFAFSISRSSGFIGNLDTGRSNASQETIDRICSVYGANEEWLKTGTGPMFVPGREQNPVDKDNIGKRIKEIRKKAELTQDQFAKTIGYSKNQITLVEIGKVNPSNEFLRAVSRSFGVSLAWLKTGVEGHDDLSDIIDWLRKRQDVVDELRKRLQDE